MTRKNSKNNSIIDVYWEQYCNWIIERYNKLINFFTPQMAKKQLAEELIDKLQEKHTKKIYFSRLQQVNQIVYNRIIKKQIKNDDKK